MVNGRLTGHWARVGESPCYSMGEPTLGGMRVKLVTDTMFKAGEWREKVSIVCW